MSGRQPEPGERIEIDDPEDLSQTQRIKELLQRRREVIDARDEAYDAQMLGEATPEEAMGFYRRRIESLIIDVWSTLQKQPEEVGDEGQASDGGTTLAQHYLEEAEIAEIEVPPPDEFQPDGNERLGPQQPTPEPKTVTIRGLRWFLDNDGAISKTFEVRRFDPPGTEVREVEVPVPMKALDKGLITIVEWLDQAGIDADIDHGEQRTEITEEVIEEVDEWRKQTLKQMDN